MFVLYPGTQQLDLRKASIGSNPRPTSLQEALNQLQSTIKLVGADKRYVYNWVLNLIEMVSFSTYLLQCRSRQSWSCHSE